MKYFAVLLSCFAYAHAGLIGAGYGAGYGIAPVAIASTGASASNRVQDIAGNYAFGYKENGPTGGTTREERGDAWGNKAGSYSLHVGDGRVRTVKYVADAHGFRAAISTNEPGTAPNAAAATIINAPIPKTIHAAPIGIATAPIAAKIAAPIGLGLGAPLGLGLAGPIGLGAARIGGYGIGAPLAAAPIGIAAAPIAAKIAAPIGLGLGAPLGLGLAGPIGLGAAKIGGYGIAPLGLGLGLGRTLAY